jgi:CMP-N-acetylneuraminic acid synthetase
MNKETLDNYMELEDDKGIQTLFRKFDKGTWIFQFNKDGKLIGQVCVSSENMNIIQNAPSIKAGDGHTIQTI